MGLFSKKKASTTMSPMTVKAPTAEEEIALANKGFSVDVVRSYQANSPQREVFVIIEQVKQTMQRVCDMDKHEYELKQVIVYEGTGAALAAFFMEKGFEVHYDVELVNGKRSLTLKVSW